MNNHAESELRDTGAGWRAASLFALVVAVLCFWPPRGDGDSNQRRLGDRGDELLRDAGASGHCLRPRRAVRRAQESHDRTDQRHRWSSRPSGSTCCSSLASCRGSCCSDRRSNPSSSFVLRPSSLVPSSFRRATNTSRTAAPAPSTPAPPAPATAPSSAC